MKEKKELKDKSVQELLHEWNDLSLQEKIEKLKKLGIGLKNNEEPLFESYLHKATIVGKTDAENEESKKLCHAFYGNQGGEVDCNPQISFFGTYNSYGVFGKKSPNASPQPSTQPQSLAASASLSASETSFTTAAGA